MSQIAAALAPTDHPSGPKDSAPRASRPATQGFGPEARHFHAILEALELLTEATAEEIGDRTGLGMVAVARRLPELEKFGLVAPVGRTRLNRSGRAGRVWTLVGA